MRLYIRKDGGQVGSFPYVPFNPRRWETLSILLPPGTPCPDPEAVRESEVLVEFESEDLVEAEGHTVYDQCWVFGPKRDELVDRTTTVWYLPIKVPGVADIRVAEVQRITLCYRDGSRTPATWSTRIMGMG